MSNLKKLKHLWEKERGTYPVENTLRYISDIDLQLAKYLIKMDWIHTFKELLSCISWFIPAIENEKEKKIVKILQKAIKDNIPVSLKEYDILCKTVCFYNNAVNDINEIKNYTKALSLFEEWSYEFKLIKNNFDIFKHNLNEEEIKQCIENIKKLEKLF